MRFIRSVHREFPTFLPDYVRPDTSAKEVSTFPSELNPTSTSGGNPAANHADHGSGSQRQNPTPDLS